MLVQHKPDKTALLGAGCHVQAKPSLNTLWKQAGRALTFFSWMSGTSSRCRHAQNEVDVPLQGNMKKSKEEADFHAEQPADFAHDD